MKKFFLIFLVAVTTVPLISAQDVITLKNGDEIQAIVQEIGDVDIKYKKFENLDGPNYSLKKSEVFMIRYINGSRDVFPDSMLTQKQTDEQGQSGNQPSPVTDHTAFTQLRKNDQSMAEFLKKNDVVLYTQFKRGTSIGNKGAIFLGSGVFATALGIAMIVSGGKKVNESYYAKDGKNEVVAGTICVLVGPAFIITSIPLIASGSGLKRRAVDEYEKKYFGNRVGLRPSLDFNLYGNGVGLALTF